MPVYEVDITEEIVHRIYVEAPNEEAAEGAAIAAHVGEGAASFVAVTERYADANRAAHGDIASIIATESKPDDNGECDWEYVPAEVPAE